jgi:hypothetical protein
MACAGAYPRSNVGRAGECLSALTLKELPRLGGGVSQGEGGRGLSPVLLSFVDPRNTLNRVNATRFGIGM